ncbi:MAG: hypothetical protein PVF50_08910 [Gammaproteobacteria bacterium]|jgi:hypothetical protein
MQLKLATAVCAVCALAGCSSSEILVAHNVELVPSAQEIAESALLDVAVVVFDSGVPDGEIDVELLEELIEQGTFVQIRRTEALYFSVQLRDTLRRSNYWGSVWITPEETRASDLNVVAEILHSDGETAVVHVNAEDATGRVWIDDDYSVEVPGGAYNRSRYGGLDPYQDLFNEIANDLAAARATLGAQDTTRLREIAALRYAEELSPEAFSGYVSEGRDGAYELARLPAVDDPQFSRTQRARQRERLFFETLNTHYVNFAREASDSYDSWRQFSREETIQVREITRSARFRTGMGIASIVASIVYGRNSDGEFSDRVIRDSMMYIGMDMLRTSASRRQEKRIHVDTLEELSSSFDDEVEPMVVEVAGTQRRLTGTAEIQYDEWKQLLRELYQSETGFEPEQVEMFVEPVVEPPVVLPGESAADSASPATAEPPSEEPSEGVETGAGA